MTFYHKSDKCFKRFLCFFYDKMKNISIRKIFSILSFVMDGWDNPTHPKQEIMTLYPFDKIEPVGWLMPLFQ